jgi:hypothetical protein
MSDESYIIKPTDPSAIVRLQDPALIEQLLDQPLAIVAGAVTEWIKSGNGYCAGVGLRVAQAALKGRVFQQLARELDELRSKGKIPDDFAEKKFGYQTWVELLTVLDGEPLDEDRLEALKAMFYAVNKVGATDGERILGYQLFQIAKRLTSRELLLLRAVFDAYNSGEYSSPTATNLGVWAEQMGKRLGHGLLFLVMRDQAVLEQQGLISPRQQ